MLLRPYGSSGEQLSIIGFGGIVVARLSQSEANTIVREAYDRGVNYFDVAPTYMDAEDRLGPALEPFRHQVFLACKTEKRDRHAARHALETSLRKLRTDYFDLYQLHGLQSLEEAQRCFAAGGAMEVLVEARQAGLVRYLGFSAHSVEAALYCLQHFAFDSVLFPLHYPSYYSGFGVQVVEEAQRRNAAILALKAMARGPWPDDADRSAYPKCWYQPETDRAAADRALRWTLSLPVTAAIPPGDERMFRMALDIAERFRPLSEEEMHQMEKAARSVAPLFRQTDAATS